MYKYKIIKKNSYFVIVNKTLKTHCHMPNYKGCIQLLKLIKSGKEIKNPYFIEAKRRLITPLKEDEYTEKRKK